MDDGWMDGEMGLQLGISFTKGSQTLHIDLVNVHFKVPYVRIKY
jgi:hypothetical protein